MYCTDHVVSTYATRAVVTLLVCASSCNFGLYFRPSRREHKNDVVDAAVAATLGAVGELGRAAAQLREQRDIPSRHIVGEQAARRTTAQQPAGYATARLTASHWEPQPSV